ncbi:MAG: HAMP domain-containing histidine kinase [Candidatus Eremiobacteraeota bacterium]|nr:HAMP domain-containing histidine kinase [Candidatus Eremiobacteraeota bacterium]MCW5869024.1 HAMP domain-containing histidine kinase [Candidatus Eremiobacteraeota bacterium]
MSRISNFLVRPLESLVEARGKVTPGNFCAHAPLRGSLEIRLVDELKTPLTCIATMTELLQHKGEVLRPERRKRAWEVIGREITRMDQVLHDLLTLSRLDQPARDVVDLAGELLSVLESYPRVSLRGELAPGVIFGNAAGWTRSLRNLFDNALAHTLQRQRAGYELKVEDRGCGIPREDLNKVRQCFFRSERSRSRHLGGTGLGLSMVAAWVRRAGGKLELESQVEQGTCVKIWIPAR